MRLEFVLGEDALVALVALVGSVALVGQLANSANSASSAAPAWLTKFLPSGIPLALLTQRRSRAPSRQVRRTIGLVAAGRPSPTTLAVVVTVAVISAACGGTSKTSIAPSTSLQTALVRVRVVSCPIPASDYKGTPAAPQSPPATVSVAASSAPPEGARLYGARFPDSSPSYLLGPTLATCHGTWSSADGGQFMTATSASDQSRRVTMVLRAGGVGPETDLACPYIPAVLAADEALRETILFAAVLLRMWCSRSRPGLQTSTQLPFGFPPR